MDQEHKQLLQNKLGATSNARLQKAMKELSQTVSGYVDREEKLREIKRVYELKPSITLV